MSFNSGSRKKSDKDKRSKSKSSWGQKNGSRQFTSGGKGGSSSGRGGGGGRGRSGGGRRKQPTFDPSMFLNKVEETTPTKVYTATHTFADFGLEAKLQSNIEKKGYVAPMPIQDQAIPHLLEGKDVVGSANTGTGKTAAFLIPLINNVLTGKTSRVLIIAPTRELAGQIQDEFKSFAAQTGLTSALCIGGASAYFQKKALRNNPEFVVGTPGRLLDLENTNVIKFNVYDAIVLDEVDRMLDMGFIKDITSIINKLPQKRHSLFFSATMTAGLQNLMSSFLKDPVSVSVKTRQSAENVNQEVIKVGDKHKIEVLHELLIKPEFTKTLVFVSTKYGADKTAKALTERGFKVVVMHGNKTQSQRSKALKAFKEGKATILLATDVVARGIDIDDISHVINFDLPQTHEDYIHRIGRTGRADKVGQAITLV